MAVVGLLKFQSAINAQRMSTYSIKGANCQGVMTFKKLAWISLQLSGIIIIDDIGCELERFTFGDNLLFSVTLIENVIMLVLAVVMAANLLK